MASLWEISLYFYEVDRKSFSWENGFTHKNVIIEFRKRWMHDAM